MVDSQKIIYMCVCHEKDRQAEENTEGNYMVRIKTRSGRWVRKSVIMSGSAKREVSTREGRRRPFSARANPLHLLLKDEGEGREKEANEPWQGKEEKKRRRREGEEGKRPPIRCQKKE